MSTSFHNASQRMLRWVSPLVASALLSVPHAGGDSRQMVALLSGMQEVPLVNSNALGSAQVTIDTDANRLTYRISFSGLAGNETAAHIHGPAEPGQNAGVLHGLPLGPVKSGIWIYPEALEPELLNGRTYINIHSTTFPGGEIRGQIVSMVADLDAQQESPPSASPGKGFGLFTMDPGANLVRFYIAYTNLGSPETAAHIHGLAPHGTNAGVLFPLPLGSPKLGVWNYAESDEVAILRGLTYVNIHTAAFPNGAIRGQITPNVVEMDGQQEVPPNGSFGAGVGLVSIDTNTDRLGFDLRYAGLSSGETAAHIHGFAPPGVNAGVLFPLPVGPRKLGVWPYVAAQETNILAGLCYVNVHSAALPAGELRGQITFAELPPPPTIETNDFPPCTKENPPAATCTVCEECGEPDAVAKLLDPVWLHSGEFYEVATDLRVPGRGLDFIWQRKYRSKTGVLTEQGYGWDYSYNLRIERSGPDVVLYEGTGRRDVYSSQPDGTWSRDEAFRVISQDDPNNPLSAFTLEFADSGVWRFLPLDGSPAQGKAFAIVDRNGNTLSFGYDAQGRLVQIVDTLGRSYQVAYVPGRDLIDYVEDFGGRRVAYAYDANDNLVSVTSPAVTGTSTGNDFPAGKTTRYTYSSGFGDERLNHNLLTIVDGRRNDPNDPTFDPNRPYLTNVYAATLDPNDLNFDRVVRQVWGDPGDIIDIVYAPQTPDPNINNDAVIVAVVNDRVGNVREFYYDAGNRGVMAREYTGRADPDQPTTLTTNRPTAKLRPTDPDYFESRYTNNADGLITLAQHANGRTVLNEYDPNNGPLARGNRTRRETHAGPLGGTPAVIVETWEYAAGGGCCGTNFVTRHVDGRGNVTEHDYDANFNRIETRHRIAGIVENWEYNAYGQVTAHVLPGNEAGGGHRRRDESVYYATGPQTGYRASEIVDAGGLNLTTAYEYDAFGNVVRRIDPRGNDTLLEVNQLNQVVRARSKLVGGVRYERDTYYDANNNVVRIDVQNVDESGVVQPNAHFSTVYEYELLNHVVRQSREVDAGHAAVVEFAYDANRNRSLTRSGEAVNGAQPNNTLSMLYDERDLPFRHIRAAGDAGETTTQYDYDQNRNLVRETQGVGAPSPRVTTHAYDGYDRLVATSDPMGNVTTHEYDANHNRTRIRVDGEQLDVPGAGGNVRLSEIEYVYDAMDRRIRTETHFFDWSGAPLPGGQQAGRSIMQTAWSDNSQPVQETDDRGNALAHAYDGANRLALQTDARGNTRAFDYDANGNVTRLTQTDKSDTGAPDQPFVIEFSYDALDRVVQQIDGAGGVANTLSFAYDSRGNRTRQTDALGRQTRHEYDGLSRLLRTTIDMNGNGPDPNEPADIVTTQAWDDNSRLVSRTDDNGNTTQYVYDALDRQVRETFADGAENLYSYDVHHNRTGETDANGTVVASQFDLNNRLTRKDVTAFGPGVSSDTTFEEYAYDGLGRIVRAEDDDALVTRTYDSLSNLLTDVQNGRTVACTYDGMGNHTGCLYPGGRAVSSTFDALNRIASITDTTGAPQLIAEYRYVGPARVERRDLGNGTRTEYTYDGIDGVPNPAGDFGFGRVVRTRHTHVGSGTVLDDRTYTWDRADSKTQRRDIRAGGPQFTHDYTYDAANRLVRTIVTAPNGCIERDTQYTLDGAHNRTSVSGGPCACVGDLTGDCVTNQSDLGVLLGDFGCTAGVNLCPGDLNCDGQTNQSDLGILLGDFGCGAPSISGAYVCDPNTPEPADCEMNQYTQTPFDARLYDRNGNLTQSAPAGGGPAATVAYDYRNRMVRHTRGGIQTDYAYDALSRRIEKVVDATGTPQTTRYLYDGWRVIEEQDAGGATLATYVYGLYVDEVLTMRRDTNGDAVAEDYFHHADDLFNVAGRSDAGGAMVERYEYDDYGAPLHAALLTPLPGAPSPRGNPYGFTGREFDPESAWYNYRTRYLDPLAGRFTSRDAIGIWGDAMAVGNGCAYAAGAPWSQLDPLGLCPKGTKTFKGTMVKDEWLEKQGVWFVAKMEYEVTIDWECRGAKCEEPWHGDATVKSYNLKNNLDSKGISVLVVGVTESDWVEAQDEAVAKACPAPKTGAMMEVKVTIIWKKRWSVGFNPGLGPFSWDLGLAVGSTSDVKKVTERFTIDCCQEERPPCPTPGGGTPCPTPGGRQHRTPGGGGYLPEE